MNTIGMRRMTNDKFLPFDPMAYTDDTDISDPAILDVQYDYDAARNELLDPDSPWHLRHDVFRYTPLLPVDSPALVLPAGGTPIVNAPRLAKRLGAKAVYLKDETRNPTRCLKDRATAVGLSMALEQGYSDVYCASAGNAAISLAGYAAHAGIRCHAFVPARASATRLEWLRHYGAEVHVSEGNYDQAYAESEQAGAAHGWYSRNCALNPFLVEGKKTAAFEIAEDLGWSVPDIVVAPSGDGCTLGAIGKGFRELRTMRMTERIPRLVGVQSQAMQPIVQRFHGQPMEQSSAVSAAASIAVSKPRNALRLLQEIRASDGTMLAVEDAEISEAQRLLATEAGLIAEFTSAATLAAMIRLASKERLADQTIALVITGGRLDD